MMIENNNITDMRIKKKTYFTHRYGYNSIIQKHD